MATYGKKLLDSNNNVILPKTRSNLVYMNNNETLENTIKYILNGTTVVGKATKLATARNIGNASFDGSEDITLAQIGAATTAQGTKADNAMPKSGGTFTGSASAVNTNRSGGTLRNIEVKNSSSSFVSTNLIIFYRQ